MGGPSQWSTKKRAIYEAEIEVFLVVRDFAGVTPESVSISGLELCQTKFKLGYLQSRKGFQETFGGDG